MARQGLDEQSSPPTSLLTIAGRTDIEKVIFRDGTSVRLPTIASVTSAASVPTDPSPFGSRASSQSRGRPKASSISSTSSVRDQLGCFGIGNADDSATECSASFDSKFVLDVHTSRQNSDPLEYASMGAVWDSTSTLRPSVDWAAAVGQESPIHSQDQLVANAEGAGHELPQQFEDLENDLLLQDGLDDVNGFVDVENAYQDFQGPSSAPSDISWMNFTYAQPSFSVPNPSIIAEGDDTFDLETVTSTKPARKPGRIPGSKLSEKKRKKVHAMRIIGACQYCKAGRRGCDAGTPCKPCILHFGADVLEKGNHCRWNVVERLTDQILSEQSKWHAYPRDISDFFGRDYIITSWSVEIPMQFGFGPSLRRAVHVIDVGNPAQLQHSHEVYPPLSQSSTPFTRHDFVLPVKYVDMSDLHIAIDNHLGLLVDEHLHEFQFVSSRFKIWQSIHKLFLHYRNTNHDYANLLRQALKLLVLIHCSQITVPTDDPSVVQILERFGSAYTGSQTVSPCLLRAELGKVLPQLARLMLKDVLKKLLRICLVRRCEQHPIVLATFSVLMMTIESIMYNSARIGYHVNLFLGGSGSPRYTAGGYDGAARNPFASTTTSIETISVLKDIDKAAASLQLLYRNCFENCHALLLRIIEARHFTSLQKSFGEVPALFIAALNKAIHDSGRYLETKGSEKVDNIQDISCFFDRLVAQLFLLQKGPDLP